MKTKTKILTSLCILLLLLTTTIFSSCDFFGSNNDSPKLFTREATNSDIYIDVSQDFALSMNYIARPYTNIDNLQITFKYYSKDNQLLTTVIKNLGNVTKGIEFTIQVSLTEFSFWDLFKINYAYAVVTDGTVSIFA